MELNSKLFPFYSIHFAHLCLNILNMLGYSFFNNPVLKRVALFTQPSSLLHLSFNSQVPFLPDECDFEVER